MPLFHDEREDVRLEIWEAGAQIDLDTPGGLEVFVLEGSFVENGETFQPQSWLRLPCNDRLVATAGSQGCKVWIKADHLSETPRAPAT